MKEIDTSHITNWPKGVILGEADIAENVSLDVLTDTELEEYESFKNAKRKAEFVSARKLFKRLLSANNYDPKEVQLLKEKEGKPFAKLKEKHMYVSFSHSPSKVYCAFSEKIDIGLDVEPISRNISPKILQRISSESEQEIASNLKPLQIWTIKEAVVKFLGTGLRTNLNELEIVKKEHSAISVRFNDDKYIEICSFRQSDHQIALAYQSKHI